MEKKLTSKKVYDGNLLKVYEDEVLCFNGNKSRREYIKHPGGVCILGFVDNKAIIEKQYRYAYDEVLYELPAGKLELGEDPKEAGLREFEEETGYKADNLISLGCMYPSCGYSDEIIHLYYAKNIKKTHTHLDEDEQIDIEFMPLETLLEKIDNNEIRDAKTICLVDRYLRMKK